MSIGRTSVTALASTGGSLVQDTTQPTSGIAASPPIAAGLLNTALQSAAGFKTSSGGAKVSVAEQINAAAPLGSQATTPAATAYCHT